MLGWFRRFRLPLLFFSLAFSGFSRSGPGVLCWCLLLPSSFAFPSSRSGYVNFISFSSSPHFHFLSISFSSHCPDLNFPTLPREGVCVNHLKRCKTSTFDFILSVLFALFHFKQGDHPCTVSDGPTKRPQYMRISRLITVTYLLFHVHVLQWDVANPRTTKPFSNNWFCNLHGCRNLSREVTTWFRWISCF